MPDYPYNITSIMQNNMTDFSTFTNAVSANILGGNWFGLFIMIMVFSVFFLVNLNKGHRASASACIACFATAICALLLKPMGMLSDFHWWIGLSLIPVSILLMFIFREESY